MSHLITAGEAGELIARHVDRSWPNDRTSVFKILDLIQEQIWVSGLFSGSTKWYWAKVREDNTIITPHGYNKLLGVKIGHEAAEIKDVFWTFHKNGPFKEPQQSADYTNIVQHMGDFPTLLEHYNNTEFKRTKPAFNIAVISPCSPGYEDPPITVISGKSCDEKPVYSYGKSNDYRLADENEINEREILRDNGDDYCVASDILEGLQIPITNKFVTNSLVDFTEIYNIAKDPTLARVDYYACPKDSPGRAILIATLEPFETSSIYSAYKIKRDCVKQGCCYALFKRSRPEKIVAENQFFITSSNIVILNMAKYIYQTFYKDNPPAGREFLSMAMSHLASEVENENPTKTSTMQVSNPTRDAAKKRRFR